MIDNSWKTEIEGRGHVVEVHVSTIQIDDSVVVFDHLQERTVVKTVGNKDIKGDNFFGTTVFGDSYRSGRDLVKKVVWKAETERARNNHNWR